jgi:hypothetical protein
MQRAKGEMIDSAQHIADRSPHGMNLGLLGPGARQADNFANGQIASDIWRNEIKVGVAAGKYRTPESALEAYDAQLKSMENGNAEVTGSFIVESADFKNDFLSGALITQLDDENKKALEQVDTQLDGSRTEMLDNPDEEDGVLVAAERFVANSEDWKARNPNNQDAYGDAYNTNVETWINSEVDLERVPDSITAILNTGKLNPEQEKEASRLRKKAVDRLDALDSDLNERTEAQLKVQDWAFDQLKTPDGELDWGSPESLKLRAENSTAWHKAKNTVEKALKDDSKSTSKNMQEYTETLFELEADADYDGIREHRNNNAHLLATDPDGATGHTTTNTILSQTRATNERYNGSILDGWEDLMSKGYVTEDKDELFHRRQYLKLIDEYKKEGEDGEKGAITLEVHEKIQNKMEKRFKARKVLNTTEEFDRAEEELGNDPVNKENARRRFNERNEAVTEGQTSLGLLNGQIVISESNLPAPQRRTRGNIRGGRGSKAHRAHEDLVARRDEAMEALVDLINSRNKAKRDLETSLRIAVETQDMTEEQAEEFYHRNGSPSN